IDRRERARPPARANERRAAAVDDVNRAVRYSAAVGRGDVGDDVSPCKNCVELDATASPRARRIPSPACTELGFTRVRPALVGRSRIYPTSAGGLGRGHATRPRGHAKRFTCARSPPPHPSPARGGGSRPSSSLALIPLRANGGSICICVCICITTLPQGRSDELGA